MSIIDNLSRKKLSNLRKTMFCPYNFKGSITYSKLPTTGNEINDTYYCTDKNCKYTWNGSAWHQSGLNDSDIEAKISELKTILQDNYDQLSTTDKNNYDALLAEIEKYINSGSSGDGTGATKEQIEQIVKNSANIDDLADNLRSIMADYRSSTLIYNPDNGYSLGEDAVYFNHVCRETISKAELIGAKLTIIKSVDNENVEETIVLEETNIVEDSGVLFIRSALEATYPLMYAYIVMEDGTLIGDTLFDKGVWLANSDESAASGEVYFVKYLVYGENLKEQVKQNSANISKLSEEIADLDINKVEQSELETEVANQLDSAKADIVTELISQIGGMPIFGTVDDDNTITVTSSLPNGSYTLMYEDSNGTVTEIGIVEVTDGVTVVTYTNQIPISTDSDGTVFGYQASSRINSSGLVKTITSTGADPCFATGFIPVSANAIIRMKNCYFDPDGTAEVYGEAAGGCNVRLYDSSYAVVGGATWDYFVEGFSNSYYKDIVIDDSGNCVQFAVVADVAFIRLTLGGDAENAVVTVNEEIS